MHEQYIPAVKSAAKDLLPRIIEIRRAIHQYPELSFQEEKTAIRIKDLLDEYEISYSDGWAGHGIVATVKGDEDGPVIMLRGDMDALPIQEATDLSFMSSHQGIMHACGHDIHSSCLVGAAIIINQLRSYLKGEVRFIFQPGEEKLPGGASIMIKEGLFKNVSPVCILGQHVFPSLPAGHVGFRSGLYMASADELYVTVHGKGGHAATPHLCIDPILIASKIVTGLQEIISRKLDPMFPAVLSIGKIYSDGGATNVIPEKVHLEGTLRVMDEKWRKEAHGLIRSLIEQTALASGATASVHIEIGYPSLYNDEFTTQNCRDLAIQYLGSEYVHDLPQRMSSEDFAFYTHEVPGTFYRIGTGWKDPEKNYPVHSNKFNPDESSIETGMGLMAYYALGNCTFQKVIREKKLWD